MAMIRVLFCHSKGESDLLALCGNVKYAMATMLDLTPDDIEVITAQDDFLANALSAGGWMGWPRDVVYRLHVDTLEPYYDAFVLPKDIFGKGTAGVIAEAFAAGRDVFYMAENKLIQARCLKTNDSSDWFGGWEVLPAE